MAAVLSINVYAQKVVSDDTQNGVRKIQTSFSNFNIGIKAGDLKSKGSVGYSLCKFISAEKSQYMLLVQYMETEKANNFPDRARIIIKNKKQENLELIAVESFMTDGYPLAFFPITEQELKTLFIGTEKIRIELLSADKKGIVTPNYEDFKKASFGKDLEKMYTAIGNYVNAKNKKGKTRENFSSNF